MLSFGVLRHYIDINTYKIINLKQKTPTTKKIRQGCGGAYLLSQHSKGRSGWISVG